MNQFKFETAKPIIQKDLNSRIESWKSKANFRCEHFACQKGTIDFDFDILVQHKAFNECGEEMPNSEEYFPENLSQIED